MGTGRSRVGPLLPLLVVGLCARGGGAAPPPGADPTSGVRITRGDGVTRLEATVPGRLLDYAVVSLTGGERRIVLLVEPLEYRPGDDNRAEDDSSTDHEAGDAGKIPDCPGDGGEDTGEAVPDPARRLYALRPSGEGGLSPIRDDLPHDGKSIEALDVDGDGNDELLLEREHGLLLVEPDGDPGPPVTLISDPSFEWTRIERSGASGGDDVSAPVVTTVGLGSLRLFGPDAAAEGWRLVADVELPLEAGLAGNGIRISSAVPAFVGRRSDGTLTFATGPEARIGRRLEARLIEVTPSGETTVTECWAGLPEAEDLLESFFLLLDDRPVLLVTTKPAGKLALFGEKRLRLYPLRTDRSRLGVAPLLALQSHMNLWQDGTALLHDADGDGRADLVLGYWKGLIDDKVVLDVYRRREDGSFEESPRTTAFNVKDGDRGWLRFGSDLDGDGLADLLLENHDGTLLLYPGLASPNARRLVDRHPRRIPRRTDGEEQGYTMVTVGFSGAQSWSIPDPDERRPRFVDVDGDGHDEIVLRRRGGAQHPGVLTVVRPRG